MQRYRPGHKHLFLLLCPGLLIALLPSAAAAQDSNGAFLSAMSGGFTYVSGHLSAPAGDDTEILSAGGLLPGRNNFGGWNVSLGGRLNRFIAIEGDISGIYSRRAYSYPDINVCIHEMGLYCPSLENTQNGSAYMFLVGPRIGFSLGRFTPFGEVLAGLAVADEKVGEVTSSAHSAAVSAGGGLAFRLTPSVDWYLRADWLRTNFQISPSPQNSVQASTGISVRLCAFKTSGCRKH
jgi:hypothetical protein